MEEFYNFFQFASCQCYMVRNMFKRWWVRWQDCSFYDLLIFHDSERTDYTFECIFSCGCIKWLRRKEKNEVVDHILQRFILLTF